MSGRQSEESRVLNLRAGEWVEVRGKEEILATLDKEGQFENLPFMPEMFQYCGRRFRVFKRADKTCDNIVPWGIRRMMDSVHLEGLRCDGSSHGGCQALCMLFWKEAWLKRAQNNFVRAETLQLPVASADESSAGIGVVLQATQKKSVSEGTVYSCQATEMRNYTHEMKWWDPRQYIRDIRSRNLDSGLAGNSKAERRLETILATLKVLQSLVITLFNRSQSRHGRPEYPPIAGELENTPVETLDLQPGELVQVKTKEQIIATLDKHNRNRGLSFDSEMLEYCGGIYRVLSRVHHIIDEKNGKMMHMKKPCIILEGVYCRSDYHRLCPRAIYSYWRENWLQRVSESTLTSISSLQHGIESSGVLSETVY